MKKLLIFLGICVSIAHGQAARFGDQNPTQNTVVVPGVIGQLVRVVPNAVIEFCAWPANAVPCTNKVTTYTDITLTTACPTSTQVVLSGTNICTGSADAQGNWGVWVPPGTYQYTFTSNGNNYGPFYALPVGATVATLNCPGAVTGAIGYFTTPTGFNCDNNFITDGHGNFTAQSGTFAGPVNGFYTYIGGGAAPGTVPTYKLPANAIRFAAPATVGTPYYMIPPATRCAVGQTWILQGETTDANGDKVDTYQCGNVVATGTEVQVNGVDTTAQTPINFQDSSTVTFSNPGTGVITATAVASAVPQISTPTAPTAVVNGTPASTSYSYAVVGCEDGPTCSKHTAASTATVVATGAATITSVNSITLSAYADTLYGPRCYNIYRTASAGTPSSTGLIGNCVWKSFIDTGLAGDSSTAPNTNTTALDTNGVYDVVNPCNSRPKAPAGIDGLPCSPKAMDDEFTYTFGAPGDANSPFWPWTNQNSATATLTNGVLALSSPSRGSTVTDNLNCLFQAVPTAPYTFVAAVSYINVVNSTQSNGGTGMFFTDGTKLESIGVQSLNSANNGKLMVTKWTNTTTFSSNPVVSAQETTLNQYIYFKLQNDSTNIIFSSSMDGVSYVTQFSEAKGAFLSTAPTKVGFCVDNSTGASVFDIDYFRRTQ